MTASRDLSNVNRLKRSAHRSATLVASFRVPIHGTGDLTIAEDIIVWLHLCQQLGVRRFWWTSGVFLSSLLDGDHSLTRS
jgi:hypothetical protein